MLMSRKKHLESLMKARKLAVLLTGIMALSLLSLAQTPRQVKVIVDDANIRSQPTLDAEILDVVSAGTVFDVVEKAGLWYTIIFSTDQSGRAVYGYIHESMVSPIGTAAPEPKAAELPKEREPAPAPPVVREQPPAPQPQEIKQDQPRSSHGRVISGSFIKAGWNDRWLASFGYDFGLARNFGLGIELQPYFNNDAETDITVIQMNVFINAKTGLKLGFLKLFGGGGIGPAFSLTSTEIERESSSEFRTLLAYHFLTGIELDFNTVGLTFEFQMIQVSDPNIDPDRWQSFFLFGLRF
jgi:hypothetical protein